MTAINEKQDNYETTSSLACYPLPFTHIMLILFAKKKKRLSWNGISIYLWEYYVISFWKRFCEKKKCVQKLCCEDKEERRGEEVDSGDWKNKKEVI